MMATDRTYSEIAWVGSDFSMHRLSCCSECSAVVADEAGHDEWHDDNDRIAAGRNPPQVTGKGCPKCGSPDLVKRGFHRTQLSVFQRYQCKGCGGYSRATKRKYGTQLRSA